MFRLTMTDIFVLQTIVFDLSLSRCPNEISKIPDMQWEATVKISEWDLPDWQPKVLNLRTCQEDPGLWVCAPDSTEPVEL